MGLDEAEGFAVLCTVSTQSINTESSGYLKVLATVVVTLGPFPLPLYDNYKLDTPYNADIM